LQSRFWTVTIAPNADTHCRMLLVGRVRRRRRSGVRMRRRSRVGRKGRIGAKLGGGGGGVMRRRSGAE